MLAEQMRFSVPWTDPLSKMRVDGVNERRGETKKLPKIHTIHFQALVLWVPEEVFYKIILYSSPGLEDLSVIETRALWPRKPGTSWVCESQTIFPEMQMQVSFL